MSSFIPSPLTDGHAGAPFTPTGAPAAAFETAKRVPVARHAAQQSKAVQ
jgi:hypothetical protein